MSNSEQLISTFCEQKSAFHVVTESNNNENFWHKQSSLIEWQQAPSKTVTQIGDTPRQSWFEDGITNLCHNAVDRHLKDRASQTALIQLDARGKERKLSYAELHVEVSAMSEILRGLGITVGDRVLIYMPMIVEAHIAMLACTRIGAIHVVVFAGLPAPALAERLSASNAKIIISASAGLNHGKYVSYRPFLLAAISQSQIAVNTILMIDRDINVEPYAPLDQEMDYSAARDRVLDLESPCVWLPATATSHLLYTSGTSGQSKGILRDTGGYAVGLLTTLKEVYQITSDNEVIFTTADVGWVVGHSYGVYAPLLAGLTSLVVEGGPLHGSSRYWWQIVARYRVTRMLSSPSAMRLLRQFGKQDAHADISSLRMIYLAGEVNDTLTAEWLSETLQIPVAEHYWQTESGWPILSGSHNVLQSVLGRKVAVVDPHSGAHCKSGETGMIVVQESLFPGGMTSLWGNNERHDQLYWQCLQGEWCYLTQDWGITDTQGRISVLGRIDDIINIGGQRISTCEIENVVLLDWRVKETAVVPVYHPTFGQLPLLYVVVSDLGGRVGEIYFKRQLSEKIVAALGRVARPRRILIVDALPKTHSGKIIRRLLVPPTR